MDSPLPLLINASALSATLCTHLVSLQSLHIRRMLNCLRVLAKEIGCVTGLCHADE